MFSRSEVFSKPGSGTTFVIVGQGQVSSAADGKFSRNFIEVVSSVAIDGLTSETWSLAIQMPGSSEWKTLATSLAATAVYLIDPNLLYQAIKVTISATTACKIHVMARAQVARNYG